MAKKYDILIVGAGLYGATCARMLTDKGYKCMMIEKNPYVGGLCATKRIHNIDVHMYGPHVFHTNEKEVWDFVNKYAKFNNYKHNEIILANRTLYKLPVDILTYNKFFGTITVQAAYNEIKKEINNCNIMKPENFEDTLIMQYGSTLYSMLFKNYYEKKYLKSCSELAPIMPDMQPSYFKFSPYMYETQMQGIPENGYTNMVENMIGNDIPIMLNTDFCSDMKKFSNLAEVTIYTGPIELLFNYKYGELDWATTEIKEVDESIKGTQIFGNSVTKMSDKGNDLVRATEHKWFNPERINDKEWINHNIVTYEYKKKWTRNDYPKYALLSNESTDKYKKYEILLSKTYPNILVGGTKGLYINMSMDETIYSAIETCKKI